MARRHAAAAKNGASVQLEGPADAPWNRPTNRRTSRPPRRAVSGWFRVPRGRLRRIGDPPSHAWSVLIALVTFGLLLLLGSLLHR